VAACDAAAWVSLPQRCGPALTRCGCEPPQSCDVEVLVGRGRGGWEDQGRDDANACAAIVGVGTADPKRSECAGPAGEPKLATLTFIEYPAIDYIAIDFRKLSDSSGI